MRHVIKGQRSCGSIPTIGTFVCVCVIVLQIYVFSFVLIGCTIPFPNFISNFTFALISIITSSQTFIQAFHIINNFFIYLIQYLPVVPKANSGGHASARGVYFLDRLITLLGIVKLKHNAYNNKNPVHSLTECDGNQSTK